MRWQDQAACRNVDPDLFFPSETDKATALQAKQVCGRCVVKDECLSYALWAREDEGIWGGKTESERRTYRRRIRARRTA